MWSHLGGVANEVSSTDNAAKSVVARIHIGICVVYEKSRSKAQKKSKHYVSGRAWDVTGDPWSIKVMFKNLFTST